MKRGNSVGKFNESEWRADQDMRTLMEAEQIKRDPKRLKAAKEAAKKRLDEAKAVAGVTENS